MEKNKRKESFLINLAILGILVALLVIVGITDESKDDLSVQVYILGCDGNPCYMHNWISSLWILPLYYLQRLIPHVAVHYAVQVGLIYTSIMIIVNIIMERIHNIWGILISILSTFIIFFQTIATFNFTRTAITCVVAGILLIWDSNKLIGKIGGILLFLIGTIIRYDVVFITFGFLAIIIWKKWMENNSDLSGRKALLKEVMFLIIAIICAFGFNCISNMIISKNPEWNRYVEKNNALAEIMDYNLAEYEENKEGYAALGISENDYKMLTTRMANSDSNFFSEELYNRIASKYSGKWKLDLSYEAIYSWIRNVGKYVVKCYFSWYILLLLFLSFLNKKNRIFVFAIGGCMLAYLAFLGIMGRMVDRVTFGIFLSAGMSVLLGITEDQYFRSGKNNKKQNVVVMGAILAILGISAALTQVEKHDVNDEMVKVFKYMSDNSDKFYGYTRYSISEVQAINNLLLVDTYWNTGNSMYLTQLDISPNERQKLEEYGINNLYAESVDSDIIRFVDKTYIGRIETYIQEHYCQSAYAILEDNVGGYNIYKIVSN